MRQSDRFLDPATRSQGMCVLAYVCWDFRHWVSATCHSSKCDDICWKGTASRPILSLNSAANCITLRLISKFHKPPNFSHDHPQRTKLEKLSNGASIPKKWRHVLATKELHGWFASAKGITTGSGYQQLQDLNTFSQCQTYQVALEWGWSRNVCRLNTGCQVLCFYYPQWQQPRCDRYHWVYCKAYQSCKQTALRAEIS